MLKVSDALQCNILVGQGQVKLLKQVLDKVNEAFGTIRNLEAQANLLEPKLDISTTNVKELREKVEKWRERYIEVMKSWSS